jgi:hypothetical protein
MKTFLYAIALYIICLSSTCIAASSSGTTIPPATQIVDSNGGVWTVSSGLCFLNGAQANGCSNVQTLLFYYGVIYVGNTFGAWYQWNGSSWTQIAGDPRGGGTSANGTTIPPATQIVDSNGGVWTVSSGRCFLNGV